MSVSNPQKSVVITGGFGTLGLAVGRAFSHAGARIALIDRAPVPEQLRPEFPAPPHMLCGSVDLSQAVGAQQAINAVAAQLGGVDVLVNVAGGFRWETVLEGSPETWDFMYSLNLKTAVNTCKAALPHLLARPFARIINIGAGAAVKAGAGMGAYGASKAGVAKLTEALSEELKDRFVTVNAVLPSVIDTPANRADMPNADFSRWVKPQAIADLIAYLASDAAAAITGASIPIQGRV
jgi:NAD(P)-dependent dehydrogenase (short-subunit alcohol dehydrogenase family)